MDGVRIERNTAGIGIRIRTAPNMALENFTLVTHEDFVAGSTKGIDAHQISGLTIRNVTVTAGTNSRIDLNEVDNVTLENVTATGATAGVGIALTAATNVRIQGANTKDNAWGGVALFTAAAANADKADTSDVTISGTFADGVPIYAQTKHDHEINRVKLVGMTTAVRNTDTNSAKKTEAPQFVYYFGNSGDAVAYGATIVGVDNADPSQTCNVTGRDDVRTCNSWVALP